MTPREIIAEAWRITKREPRLRRWGFVAALFETMRNVEILLYQTYFWIMFAQGKAVGMISVEVAFFEHLPLMLAIGITVFLVILFVLELFIPTLAEGAVIGLSAKAYNKEEVKGGLVLALYNFFPLLEVNGLFVLTDVVTVGTILSMLYRYLDGPIRWFSMSVVFALWLVAVVFSFLSGFAEESVVVNKHGVFAAISRSTKLILSHLGQVMFLLLLLFVISLRIVINAVMVLAIPAIAIGLGLLLVQFLPPLLSYSIASGVALLALLLLSYFLAYLHVFRQTVWTITFLELHKHKDLDVIGG